MESCLYRLQSLSVTTESLLSWLPVPQVLPGSDINLLLFSSFSSQKLPAGMVVSREM